MAAEDKGDPPLEIPPQLKESQMSQNCNPPF